MLKDIIQILKETGDLKFDDPVTVKLSPHQPQFFIWGASTEHGRLAVMDADEQWHEVVEEDTHIVHSLYQRVKLLEQQFVIK